MISRVRYREDGSISANIDGETLFIPDDMSNWHRRMIAEWVRAGGRIAPFTPPEPQGVQSVTARQFKLALEDAGLYDDVVAWVRSKPRRIQIAFENSGSFNRNEPMMQAGFSEMGMTKSQIDAFFEAASKL